MKRVAFVVLFAPVMLGGCMVVPVASVPCPPGTVCPPVYIAPAPVFYGPPVYYYRPVYRYHYHRHWR